MDISDFSSAPFPNCPSPACHEPAANASLPASERPEPQRPLAWRRDAALKMARDALNRHEPESGSDGDAALSESSIATYRNKGRRLLESLMAQRPVDLRGALVRSLSPYAPSANSFYATVAALNWALRKNLKRDAKALADEAQPTSVSLGLCERVEFTVTLMRTVDSLQRCDVLDESGQRPRRRQSKRRDLRYLPHGWKERLVAESATSTTFGPAVSLLAVCAPRPAELEAGVYLYGDGDHVMVLVPGVKVTDTYGQPWRELRVQRRAFTPAVLATLDEFSFMWVQVNRNSLRDHLWRLSKRLWPNLRAGRSPEARSITISAYTFRHALAEELRETSWDDEQISMAMGHCAAETQGQYGRRRRRTGKTPRTSAITSVQTARPVRPRNPDRLASLIASRQRSGPKSHP